jgi:hypothetical protein
MAKVDKSGTKPGLGVSTVEENIVFLRCKDKQCGGSSAIEISPKDFPKGVRMYQCVKCKKSTTVNVGGPVDF